MFRRLENDSTPLQLPKEWTDEFKQTLLNIYGDKCLKEDRTFEIYAFTYPEEVLLIASYVSLDKYIAPITLFLSADLKDSNKSEKALDVLCDSVGMYFDQFFAKDTTDEEEILEEFNSDWVSETISGLEVYYKVSRENVGLSIEASKLLGEF